MPIIDKLTFRRDGRIMRGEEQVGRIELWHGMHQLFIGPGGDEDRGNGVFATLVKAKVVAREALEG